MSEEAVYNFCSQKNSSGVCTDGGQPTGNLAQRLGNLYGVTVAGGLNNGGTVFEVTPGGGETVLYNFCSAGGSKCTDGLRPSAGPIFASGGNLYGVTQYGGLYGFGTAFELINQSGTWSHKVIHNFCSPTHNCEDGGYPQASLFASAGELYGTAEGGGTHGHGTVFKLVHDLTTGAWVEHVLYNFCAEPACADGAGPMAGLVKDSSGDLDGTTASGGSTNNGAVFELHYDSSKRRWVESVVHSFCTSPSCADGVGPVAPLTVDSGGNLYGTAQAGGSGNPGNGVVFKITPGNAFSVLHAFCAGANCNDGESPMAGLTLDSAGNLVGTTLSDISPQGAGGTVFTVTPAGSESLVWVFCSQTGCPDGEEPDGGVVVNNKGEIFGTAANGGKNGGGGVVFKLSP